MVAEEITTAQFTLSRQYSDSHMSESKTFKTSTYNSHMVKMMLINAVRGQIIFSNEPYVRKEKAQYRMLGS